MKTWPIWLLLASSRHAKIVLWISYKIPTGNRVILFTTVTQPLSIVIEGPNPCRPIACSLPLFFSPFFSIWWSVAVLVPMFCLQSSIDVQYTVTVSCSISDSFLFESGRFISGSSASRVEPSSCAVSDFDIGDEEGWGEECCCRFIAAASCAVR